MGVTPTAFPEKIALIEMITLQDLLRLGIAATKPVPTNDWWSKAIKENHADNLFNYPLAMKTQKFWTTNELYPFWCNG